MPTFYGQWSRKYWKNVPGPLYSTTDDLLSLLAFGDDPGHIMFDANCEFIWRQPATPEEYDSCLTAINCDEMGSFQVDGNEKWTPDLVRAWWLRQGELIDWGKSQLHQAPDDGIEKNYPSMAAQRRLDQYLRFMEREAEVYLERYIFFLEHGREISAGDTKPRL
jgi:hypothetical protein